MPAKRKEPGGASTAGPSKRATGKAIKCEAISGVRTGTKEEDPQIPPRTSATKAGIRPTGQDLVAVINRNKQLQGVRIAWSLATLREGTPETAGYLGFGTTRELRAFHFARLVSDAQHDMERTFLFRVVRLLVWHTRVISALFNPLEGSIVCFANEFGVLVGIFQSTVSRILIGWMFSVPEPK